MIFSTRKRQAREDMEAVCTLMEEGTQLRRTVCQLKMINGWGHICGERWEQKVQEWLHERRPSFEWQFLLEMPDTQQLGSPFAADIHIADWMNRLDRRLNALSKLVDYLRNEQG